MDKEGRETHCLVGAVCSGKEPVRTGLGAPDFGVALLSVAALGSVVPGSDPCTRTD